MAKLFALEENGAWRRIETKGEDGNYYPVTVLEREKRCWPPCKGCSGDKAHVMLTQVHGPKNARRERVLPFWRLEGSEPLLDGLKDVLSAPVRARKPTRRESAPPRPLVGSESASGSANQSAFRGSAQEALCE